MKYFSLLLLTGIVILFFSEPGLTQDGSGSGSLGLGGLKCEDYLANCVLYECEGLLGGAYKNCVQEKCNPETGAYYFKECLEKEPGYIKKDLPMPGSPR